MLIMMMLTLGFVSLHGNLPFGLLCGDTGGHDLCHNDLGLHGGGSDRGNTRARDKLDVRL